MEFEQELTINQWNINKSPDADPDVRRLWQIISVEEGEAQTMIGVGTVVNPFELKQSQILILHNI